MGRVINVSDSAYDNGGNFEPIPEGTRVVATVYAIEEVPVKSGENAGKPQLDVTFKVQGGQWNGREIRYQKIPLYDNGAAWKLVTFADALGWPTKPQVEIPDNIQSALGQSLTLRVGIDKNNEKYNSVVGYAPATVGADEPASAAGDAAPTWGNIGS